jgi:hypothetical protein
MFISRYMIAAAATFAGGAMLFAGVLLALALLMGTPVGFQTRDANGRVVTLQPGNPAYDVYARNVLIGTLGGGGILFALGFVALRRMNRGR